jgi:hypothetical protein
VTTMTRVTALSTLLGVTLLLPSCGGYRDIKYVLYCDDVERLSSNVFIHVEKDYETGIVTYVSYDQDPPHSYQPKGTTVCVVRAEEV